MMSETISLSQRTQIQRAARILGAIMFAFALLAMIIDYRGVRPGFEYEPSVQSNSTPAMVLQGSLLQKLYSAPIFALKPTQS